MIWKVDKRKHIMLIYRRTLLISGFIYIAVYVLGQVTNALGKEEMFPLILLLFLVWLKVILPYYVYQVELTDDSIRFSKVNLLGITQNASIDRSNLILKADKKKVLKGTDELLTLSFFDKNTMKGKITDQIFGWTQGHMGSIQNEINSKKKKWLSHKPSHFI